MPMAWNDGAQPTLRPGRLVLRPFRPSDGPRVQALAGERAIADTTASIPHPYPDGAAEAWISNHPDHWRAGTSVTFAISRAGDDQLIGAVSLLIDPGSSAGTLGYWIGRPYWGRGYATEAARATIHFGFETIGLNRVVATYLTRNPASGRVMEKLGMTLEGVFRQAVRKWDVFEDLAERAILRSEWESAAGGPPSHPTSAKRGCSWRQTTPEFTPRKGHPSGPDDPPV